ncbi:Spy/CpxP family protein refolding chaperone [Algoriphagus formosus]|uniref:Periplasmic heavy metal sensor n=1 Tax=Algoriphagus formosus TaxID=2007308 RepID=A0A4R5VCR6_9BACT|nr:periplasmic heavy metal sensor [Algoriphagus aquimaris]TDK50118.1 periplasmic heavy metal sensor [Algoriphagus aquimaris]
MKSLLITALFLLSSLTMAQDIFKKNLYSADQIMEAREKINLTDAQATKIKKIHAENAGEFSTLKWDLDATNAELEKLLEQRPIDQTKVLTVLDMILKYEAQLKRKQLSTLVAIKNELTEEQIEKLGESTRLYGFRSSGSGAASSTLGVSSLRSGQKVVIGYPSSSSTFSTTNPSSKVDIVVAGSEDGNQPLFVIKSDDGTIEKSSMEQLDINPKDIESINVLKDKGATSLYGEKGKNGVIIITLKKGAKAKIK